MSATMDDLDRPLNKDQDTIRRLTFRHPEERLSISANLRILLATSMAGATGLSLGLSQGGTMAALRFRAENAHRLPKSQTGWYLYHKTKNYNVMFGALKEGGKLGAKIGGWTAGFFVTEEAVDRLRGRKDFLSSTVAGLGMAGAFSLLHQLPLVTAAKTTKLGLAIGVGYGLTQDVLTLAKGQRLAYVDLVLRTMGWNRIS